MTKRELAALKKELGYLKAKIPNDNFILVLKTLAVVFGSTLYFDLLTDLNVKDPMNLDSWQQIINKALSNKGKIHQRDA